MLAALSSLWKKEKITSLETRQHCAIEGLQLCKTSTTRSRTSTGENEFSWEQSRPVHVCVGKGGDWRKTRETNASPDYGYQKPKEKSVTWNSTSPVINLNWENMAYWTQLEFVLENHI